jgi:hypothetical protein
MPCFGFHDYASAVLAYYFTGNKKAYTGSPGAFGRVEKLKYPLYLIIVHSRPVVFNLEYNMIGISARAKSYTVCQRAPIFDACIHSVFQNVDNGRPQTVAVNTEFSRLF